MEHEKDWFGFVRLMQESLTSELSFSYTCITRKNNSNVYEWCSASKIRFVIS